MKKSENSETLINNDIPNRPLRQTKYKYVDSIPEHLTCLICTLPLEDALIHKSCEEMFCGSCIEGFKKCPKCLNEMTSDDLSPVIRVIRNSLDELKVYCPTCKLSVSRGELNDHENKYCILCKLKYFFFISYFV